MDQKPAKKNQARFEHKPIPWMYSTAGAIIAAAVMKLHPIHRKLSELEIKNVQDYFNSDFISPKRRRQIDRATAFMMTYYSAIKRMTSLTRFARQDYYALNRKGCFAVKEMPRLESPSNPDSPHYPLVIVPGLNTPPMFFREMHAHFTKLGYNVSVLTLPENGLADVEKCAEALRDEMERLREKCGALKVNVIGHCLGGLIAQYCLEQMDREKPSMVSNLISLGTGFLGAEGVQQLKSLWLTNHPGKVGPRVFDQLIQWNINVAKRSTEVAYHSMLSVWDFMVHFRNGLLDTELRISGPTLDGSEQEVAVKGMVNNYIIEDPDIDHLTLALHPQVFQRIEQILTGSDPSRELQAV